MGLTTPPTVAFPTIYLFSQPALQAYSRPRMATQGGFTFHFWTRAFSYGYLGTRYFLNIGADSNSFITGKGGIVFSAYPNYSGNEVLTLTWWADVSHIYIHMLHSLILVHDQIVDICCSVVCVCVCVCVGCFIFVFRTVPISSPPWSGWWHIKQMDSICIHL